MASKNVETHRAAHQAWNRRDFDAVVSQMAPSISYTDHPRGQTVITPGEFKEWVTTWAQLFSDGQITDAGYLGAGDAVVAQFVARGTNDGLFGPYPATGRELTFALCEILRFDEHGLIVGGDVYYDQLSMLVQLGHVEIPAAAGA